MEMTMEQITNSVLGAILHADKYVNTLEVSIETGVAENKVIEAINRIKQHNEFFLDTYGNVFDDGLINARVPEFFRDEVKKFLHDGGFVSRSLGNGFNSQEKSDHQDVLQNKLQPDRSEYYQSEKERKAKIVLKAAGLIALATVIVGKFRAVLRRRL